MKIAVISETYSEVRRNFQCECTEYRCIRAKNTATFIDMNTGTQRQSTQLNVR